MAGASEDAASVISTNLQESSSALEHGTNVLVLCAGAGTSAMLANALTEGAEEYNVPITASAGAYGSHYDIMKDFDMIILAPQVGSYYDDIKEDAPPASETHRNERSRIYQPHQKFTKSHSVHTGAYLKIESEVYHGCQTFKIKIRRHFQEK